MVDKILDPILFPLLLVGLFWLSERNNNHNHKADREKMRFWIGVAILIACGELTTAWHNEIGRAWQNHPELSFFAALAVFATIFRIAAPISPHLFNALSNNPPLNNQNKVL